MPLQLWFYHSLVIAMARRTSRVHPYRATSEVETPSGPRPASWFAGPNALLAGIEPPPDRPILIIVDYTPLQELTHPSERDHGLYAAMTNHNLRNTTAGELESLFTWARLMYPAEANLVQIHQLRPIIDCTTPHTMEHPYGGIGLGVPLR